MAKTVLKWAGGKTILLPKIKERLEKINITNSTFYDVFAGGGSVSFEFCDLFENTILNDKNYEIINVYKVIKENPEKLIKLLYEYQSRHSKDYYYRIREMDRKPEYKELDNTIKAARTIYLNKTCYNGLYRVNSKGQFNVPIGRQNRIKIYDENDMMEIHKKLQKINILNHDYNVAIKQCKTGDIVYLDPPYDKISNNSFVEYNKIRFDGYDQERLLKDIDFLTKKGVYVIASNSYTERIAKLYSSYIDENSIVNVRRSIGSSVSSRNKVPEILIDNIKQVKSNVNKDKKA